MIDAYQPVYQSLLQSGGVTVQEATAIIEAVAAGARAGAKQHATVAGSN